MNLRISEIQIVPCKPENGFLGRASCILDEQFYLGELGIYTDLKNGGFRVVFPTKKLTNGQKIPICHPINREAQEAVQSAIVAAWENLVKRDENPREKILQK